MKRIDPTKMTLVGLRKEVTRMRKRNDALQGDVTNAIGARNELQTKLNERDKEATAYEKELTYAQQVATDYENALKQIKDKLKANYTRIGIELREIINKALRKYAP
jgi:predicted  nucleic acid-binding Zn-ribbon protein